MTIPFVSFARALALALLVLGVVADDHDLPLALDDFALLTHLLYGRTYFHCIITFLSQRGLCFAWPGLGPGKGLWPPAADFIEDEVAETFSRKVS